MPAALIAVVVVAIIGVGAYFFTSTEPTDVPAESEFARTETDAANNETSETPEVMSSDEPESEDTAPVAMSDNEPDAMDTSMPNDETAATPYESEQTYLTPARTSHEIDVNLTVADDGTVVGANVVYDNGDGFSNGHQERFDGAFRDEVVGQNINNIELSRVGGASLTSEAFNDAVADIRAQVS